MISLFPIKIHSAMKKNWDHGAYETRALRLEILEQAKANLIAGGFCLNQVHRKCERWPNALWRFRKTSCLYVLFIYFPSSASLL